MGYSCYWKRYWRRWMLFTSESASFNDRATTHWSRLTSPCWRRCGSLSNREYVGRIGENSDFKTASGHNQISEEWECLVSESVKWRCDACWSLVSLRTVIVSCILLIDVFAVWLWISLRVRIYVWSYSCSYHMIWYTYLVYWSSSIACPLRIYSAASTTTAAVD